MTFQSERHHTVDRSFRSTCLLCRSPRSRFVLPVSIVQTGLATFSLFARSRHCPKSICA
jgi:hypothetical protein